MKNKSSKANFFVRKFSNGKMIGPLTSEQVYNYCFESRIKGRDMISTDKRNWRQALEIPELSRIVDVTTDVDVPVKKKRRIRKTQCLSSHITSNINQQLTKKRRKKKKDSNLTLAIASISLLVGICFCIIFVSNMLSYQPEEEIDHEVIEIVTHQVKENKKEDKEQELLHTVRSEKEKSENEKINKAN